MRYCRHSSGEIVTEEKDEVPQNKEEGMERWRKEMELRFLHGDDVDFDYTVVDESEMYDDRGLEEQEEEERYFDGEEPAWIPLNQDGSSIDVPKTPSGETGIQDF